MTLSEREKEFDMATEKSLTAGRQVRWWLAMGLLAGCSSGVETTETSREEVVFFPNAIANTPSNPGTESAAAMVYSTPAISQFRS